jgi:hypothetical protein
MTVRAAINGFDRIDFFHTVAESGRAGIDVVAISDLRPADTSTPVMLCAGRPDKVSLPTTKSRSKTVEILHGISAWSIGIGLARVEQAILTIMRSDAFLGSKWTHKELHFFLCEMLFGRCQDADQSIHAWRSFALRVSIRRGLASLQHKGLVKYTAPRQRWLSMPPEIKWSLVDEKINAHNVRIKTRKGHFGRLFLGGCQ